jgi:hypothetical protein
MFVGWLILFMKMICFYFCIARGQKVGLIEKADSHVGDSIRLEKK